MPCTPFRTSDGRASGFVCTRGAKKRRCSVPGCSGPGHYACDQSLGPGKTCDKLLCGHHRHNVGPELDLCPTHARQQLQQPALFEAPGQPPVVSLALLCHCGAIAPLPCDGRAGDKRCATVVCGRHAVLLGRRWLCAPCARALAAPPPQLDLLGATP